MLYYRILTNVLVILFYVKVKGYKLIFSTQIKFSLIKLCFITIKDSRSKNVFKIITIFWITIFTIITNIFVLHILCCVYLYKLCIYFLLFMFFKAINIYVYLFVFCNFIKNSVEKFKNILKLFIFIKESLLLKYYKKVILLHHHQIIIERYIIKYIIRFFKLWAIIVSKIFIVVGCWLTVVNFINKLK